jgi:hypothetical protein
VVPASALNFMPFYMSVLILKVQQHPKLETRIRDRDLYAIVAGLLLCFREERVNVNVKNASDCVVLQILIFSLLRGLFGSPLKLGRSLDQRLWRSARLDLQLNKTSDLVPEVVEVVALGYFTFADDQDPPLYVSKGAAAP